MIRFENVVKKFALGNSALNDVTFSVEPHEFIFLVGPSGAGKTTILKLLIRDLMPSSGKVFLNDQEISAPSFSGTQNIRRSIGFVFQDFKVIPEKNVFENVALSLQVLGIPNQAIRSTVMEALELVGLTRKERVFPVQLSAGELQRVAIARAIIGERDLILADEPTGNLDPKTTWEIMRIFKKLENKKTVLIATHNTDIVNSMKKRVIVLKDGKIVTDKKKGGYEL